jgi:dienelactone hydrolase
MKIWQNFTLILGIISFTIQALWSSEALSGKDLEPGDKMLLESVSGKHEMYRLWQGDGRREDDPSRYLQEIYNGRIRQVAKPTIMVMKPATPNGKAVVVFPGGGYRHLAAQKEGSLVGEWLNKQGITAFVVKYRVPTRDGVSVALQDGQRAIRFVRANAGKFAIDPEKVGVMGFSAGGHLSASMIHQFKEPSYESLDEVDKQSCKPNFGILVYPAYLDRAKSLDNPLSQVADAGIPIYITISKKDGFIKGLESYLPVLEKAKVDFAYFPYEEGAHGTGLGGFPWTVSCEKWLSSK